MFRLTCLASLMLQHKSVFNSEYICKLFRQVVEDVEDRGEVVEKQGREVEEKRGGGGGEGGEGGGGGGRGGEDL